MSFSKSILTSNPSMNKKVINPVNDGTAQSGGGGGMQLNSLLVETLKKIENSYVSKIAVRDYTNIPSDMFGYLTLNETMTSTISLQKNNDLKLLLQIASDGLTGALNYKTLSAENAELEINNVLLTKKIEEILSNKNEITTICAEVCGKFEISKTFKLAPTYGYYIYLYGMPEYGVGFDAKKLQLVKAILAKNGIEV